MLTARTTVDLDMQQAAQDALDQHLRQTGSRARQPLTSGAMVSMEPDGAVRAMVGGLDYGDSQFNRATHAHRQPGSSFKLYVYATALRERLHAAHDRARLRAVHAATGHPQNYGGGGSGRSHAAIDALQSRSTCPPSSCRCGVGRDKVLEMTQRLGITGIKKTCSMALGDYRHHAARARRRPRHVRQRRQARHALRHPRSRQLQGRPGLLAATATSRRPRRSSAARSPRT